MITPQTKQKIKELAGASTNEIAGFILENGELYPCKNQSTTPKNHFLINPRDYLKATYVGKIETVYHSHQENPEFSEFDKLNLYNHKLKGLVYCKNQDKFNWFFPEGYKNPYVGKTFEIGICDCLSIVQDYYEKEMKIILPDFIRKDGWFDKNPTIIRDNIPAGFQIVKTTEIQKNDILLFDMLKKGNPNHLGVYMGNDLLLHHPRYKLSNIEMMTEGLKERLVFGLRYVS